jgi:hypothetical protein
MGKKLGAGGLNIVFGDSINNGVAYDLNNLL